MKPLDSLMLTVLSQNTTDANSGRAFEQLTARFPTWEAVLAAPARDIADTIRSGGLAEIKSGRIMQILARINEDRGRLDLTFLKRMPIGEVRDYLLKLPGVGRKTAAVVMLFALGMPAFPVDTHVLRVSKRLGLIAPGTTMDKAHDLFEGMVAPEAMSDLHLGLIRHGRTICIARRPRCPVCVLLDLCPQIGVTSVSQESGSDGAGTGKRTARLISR
jgi:endonuclease-3